MKQIATLALVIAATLAATPPTSGNGTGPQMPPPEPGPPPAAGMTLTGGAPVAGAPKLAQAKAAFAQLQSGTLDRSMLTAEMNAALTDDKVNSVKAAIAPLGEPASFVEVRNGSQGGYPYAVYLLSFADGTKMDFIFSLDAGGKIAGMQLTPPQ